MGCDLELEITAAAAAGEYTIAVDSPAGTATGTARLDAAGLLGRRREMAASVLASAATARSGLTALERPVREVGQALFDAVFVERVYGRYTASVQEAARRGEPLRVVLRLRAAELAGLPWEAMFDAETGDYLCQREPVVRYVETAHAATPLAVDAPLRILGLVAAPRDLPRLDVAEERRRLTDAVRGLAGRGQVELVWATAGHWAELQERLAAGPWHMLHFVGHGGSDPTGGGLLALEDETTGRAAPVSAARFARLLHACRPVPRLVVLNSCQSGEAAADDLLSSTAATLVHSGISAAVAMQFAVTDSAALAFARGFYQAIAQGAPVDEAVRLGRIAIDGTSEQTLEWVTPVLYLRTNDTRLFTLPSTTTTPEPPGPPPDMNVTESLMCVDIVQSSDLAIRLGDQSADLFERFHRVQDEIIDRYRGHLYERTGDGCLAIFPSAVSGLNASLDLLDAVSDLEMEGEALYLRVGLIATDSSSLQEPAGDRNRGSSPELFEVGQLQKYCPVGRVAISKGIIDRIGDRRQLFRPAISPNLRKLKAFVYAGRQKVSHQHLIEGLTEDQADAVPPLLATSWRRLQRDRFDLSRVSSIFENELLVVLGETARRIDSNHGSAATSDAIGVIEMCAHLPTNAGITAAVDAWQDASDLAGQRDLLLVGSGICNTYAFVVNDLMTPARFDKHDGKVFGQIVVLQGDTKLRFGSRANAGRHCALVMTVANPFAPDRCMLWVAGITGRGTQAAMTFVSDLLKNGAQILQQRGLTYGFAPVVCIVRACVEAGKNAPGSARVVDYELLWAGDSTGRYENLLKSVRD